MGTEGKWGGSDTGTRHRQDSGRGERTPERGAWAPVYGEEEDEAARQAEGGWWSAPPGEQLEGCGSPSVPLAFAR